MCQRKNSIPLRRYPDPWGMVRRIYPLYHFSQFLKVGIFIFFQNGRRRGRGFCGHVIFDVTGA